MHEREGCSDCLRVQYMYDILPQDDLNSETVHSLDTNMKSSFKKFKNTTLDTESAGTVEYL